MLYPLSYEGLRRHPSWWRGWALLTGRPCRPARRERSAMVSVQPG